MMLCHFFPENFAQPLHCVGNEFQVYAVNKEHKKEHKKGLETYRCNAVLQIKYLILEKRNWTSFTASLYLEISMS